ncbi:serine/threonine transporter SstT [Bifidobacterium catenulatum]|uniref:Serine/threonine transporter SstT n=1 Tax=Bifidobacterium catenulatum TaxID=1686 RepID=A0A1V8PPG0_9BIFI|nr:serine/threonine transporter SstT [Bifidobacterium catenulatum]MDH7872766.1 serine/threonine transporter SstT [Bifidobacterium catenulatum subsp. kashiwanohense]MDH7882216.1 serine/threonine transporter SstT [Bifidobacterium catenulatum subsp. kashiwanohense]MDH7887571.1 serine/threonine transporter SstT [Bifidobacterium catenulatum subsp. kashiwanohense]OQM50556.1 serine/threonine transporter SstT [Bifidobacterium catenulatum]
MNHISKALRGVADKYNGVSLIIRIIVGLIAGTALALVVPHMAWIGEFGTLFVSALKAVAPILVFVLVASALAQGNSKLDGRFGTVLFLYLFTTFLSAVVAVLTSRMFPQTISLGNAADADVVPQGLSEVVQTLLTNIVANPIQAMIDGNYICILMWACLFGLAMKGIANESSKAFLANVADGVSQVIRWVINLAPFGIMGLVFTSVSENGLAAFTEYGSLLLLLVGTMLLMVLVFGPLVIFLYLHRNPYPLVYRCFKESGLTAFFTRSSAANIPVNMQLCEKLGLDKDMYSVSIPLGATINMNGAAVTITIMAMAAANTMGIQISLPAAILLSVVSALGACGASGVAGGSLLLIPMACSLFGISNDIAMQVVGVGFIIGVIQDSVETCLNSASDVEFAATAEYHAWLKQGRQLPAFMYSKKERQQLGIEA